MNVEKSFRRSRYLDDNQKRVIAEVEDLYVSLAKNMNQLPETWEKSLCMTKLQESKMWAIECIAKNCAGM